MERHHWIDAARVHLLNGPLPPRPLHGGGSGSSGGSRASVPLRPLLLSSAAAAAATPHTQAPALLGGGKRARSPPRSPLRSPPRSPPRSLPRPHPRSLAGSPPRSPSRAARTYFLTTARGVPLLDARGVPRRYHALKPAAAAVRAFSGFLRTDGGRRVWRAFTREWHAAHDGAARSAADIAFDAAIDAAVARGSLAPAAGAAAKSAAARDDPALFDFAVDMYLASAARPRARRYRVVHARITAPNAHELRRGINKVTHAQLVPAARPSPTRPSPTRPSPTRPSPTRPSKRRQHVLLPAAHVLGDE